MGCLLPHVRTLLLEPGMYVYKHLSKLVPCIFVCSTRVPTRKEAKVPACGTSSVTYQVSMNLFTWVAREKIIIYMHSQCYLVVFMSQYEKSGRRLVLSIVTGVPRMTDPETTFWMHFYTTGTKTFPCSRPGTPVPGTWSAGSFLFRGDYGTK